MLPFEYHPILSRQYFYKLLCIVVPLVEDLSRDCALGVLLMPHDQRMQLLQFVMVAHGSQFDHSWIAARGERTVFVEHVRDAAAHTRREVAAGLAEDHDQAARHVLASVIANPADASRRAAISHLESLAGDTPT